MTTNPEPSRTPPLRVIPIGGLGEIGMNLMLYECGDTAVVVDCGMMFPDAATMGVDVVIPDMSYLFEIQHRIVALFLTHGHEDHIGAVPFFLEKVNVPVYGLPLTLGFVRHKLEEFGMASEADLRPLKLREIVTAGAFRVEALHVTHSIVDAVALAIQTPAGVIIHTGDFKLDQTPIDQRSTDIRRLAHYGEQGVLLLASDSTNAVVPGYSGSERNVGDALEPLFAHAEGRILVTTFASHIHRIQQIVDQAVRFKKRVYFVGRSMVANVETAERLGYLRIPQFVRGTSNRPMDDARDKTVILITGTQGEPTSALSRIAMHDHRSIEIEEGDMVIVSARTIPGNERAISHVVDHLLRQGADVIYQEESEVHVSGHACQEELKTMMNLTRPRFFIPIHGTVRHMVHHAKLAAAVGIKRENTFVMTNGEIVEIDGEKGRLLQEKVAYGKVFIDHQSGEVAEVVVRDRKHLAEDGFVIAVIAIDMSSRKLLRDPEIITRGLVHVDASAEILWEVRDLLVAACSEGSPDVLRDAEILQEKVRSVLKRYFRKKFNRRPMILPVVWEM